MAKTFFQTITGLLNSITQSHTNLPDEALPRETGAPGFTDDRTRNDTGIVVQAPRKVLPDLIGGGEEVSDDYPQSAAKVADVENTEANTPRQARGRLLDTLTETHEARRTFQVAVSVLNGTNTTTQQPASPFAARYPYNHVRLTESGHLFEADDTPGAERIKESHRIGTYYEIFPDGTKVTKIVRDNFTVVVGDNEVNILGSATVTIEGNCKLYTKGDLDHQVGGNYNLIVGGNMKAEVAGDIDLIAARGGITLDTPTVDTTADLEVAGDAEVEGDTTLGPVVTSGGQNTGSTHTHGGSTGPPR